MTFNAKNLHYEKQEPAFLHRLRSENTSDRHNVSISRPQKPELETADSDGPTIVDEQGEDLTEEVYQDLLHGKIKDAMVSEDISPGTFPDVADDMVKEREKPHFVFSSGSKKRKLMKATAAETEIETETERLAAKHESCHTKIDDESKTTTTSKKKKIKLSFDDPET